MGLTPFCSQPQAASRWITVLVTSRARPIYRPADIIGRYELIAFKSASAFITADETWETESHASLMLWVLHSLPTRGSSAAPQLTTAPEIHYRRKLSAEPRRCTLLTVSLSFVMWNDCRFSSYTVYKNSVVVLANGPIIITSKYSVTSLTAANALLY